MATPDTTAPDPTTPTAPEPETPAHDVFHRPRWMVLANLAAAIFFGIAGSATFLAGRLWFPIVWWVLGLFWLRRYFWARDSPFLELSAESLRIYISPGREQTLPWNKVQAVTPLEGRLDLELTDGSKVGFGASDLAAGEFPRFSERVRELAA